MIEVKNVTKNYGNFVAVDDISFEVKDHEIVGFLGPNGAGKSTTMNMITGYIEPSKGKIVVNGYDISKSPKKVKRQIGYMPENVPLYNDLTVREFITYMAELKNVKRKERKDEVNKVIEETGLKDVQKKLIKKVSRGYKQRVSMAGALVGNPDILILDEPTVGLDPKQITEIRNLIKKLGESHTVILSSHILSEVSQICERVIIINKGKILAVDTPENLEKQTQAENSILITVEDKEDKLPNINKKIKEIKEVKLVKDNEDGTKQYLISSEKDVDIRKKLFDSLPKENITIFELKQIETTLEDAFLKVINSKEAEIASIRKQEQDKKEKREAELNSMDKKARKEAIKADKKAERQARKEEFDREWEKEKQLIKEEKEEKKREKQERKKLKQERKESKKAEKAKKEELEASKTNKDSDKEASKTNKDSDKEESKASKGNDKEENKANKNSDKEESKTSKDSDKEENKANKNSDKEESKANEGNDKEENKINKNSENETSKDNDKKENEANKDNGKKTSKTNKKKSKKSNKKGGNK